MSEKQTNKSKPDAPPDPSATGTSTDLDSDIRLYSRKEQYDAISGNGFYQKLAQLIATSLQEDGPIVASFTKRSATFHSPSPVTYQPHTLSVMLAKLAGHQAVTEADGDLKEVLTHIASHPFAFIDTVSFPGPGGTTMQLADLVDEAQRQYPDYPTPAHVIRSLLLGAALYPLLRSEIPDFPERIMNSSEVLIDADQLLDRVFLLTELGNQHEKRFSAALEDLSAAIFAMRPYGPPMRAVIRTVNHISKLHARHPAPTFGSSDA